MENRNHQKINWNNWNWNSRPLDSLSKRLIINHLTRNKQINMKYNISKKTAPKMPKLGKGTEIVSLLLSQASNDMHEPIVPMIFPVLGAQISEAKFRYPDLIWKELFGMMKNLVAESCRNKGQFTNIWLWSQKTSSITSLTGEKKFPSWENKKKLFASSSSKSNTNLFKFRSYRS